MNFISFLVIHLYEGFCTFALCCGIDQMSAELQNGNVTRKVTLMNESHDGFSNLKGFCAS